MHTKWILALSLLSGSAFANSACDTPKNDFDGLYCLSDPNEVDKLRDKHWAYVGSITTGQNNEAACDGGNVMPCVSSTGTLTFGEQDGGGLPTLQVAISGTTIAAPGKTRLLGPSDTASYTFDKKQRAYNH